MPFEKKQAADEPARVPGVAPADKVRPDQAEQRYGPQQVPANVTVSGQSGQPYAAGSLAAMREQIRTELLTEMGRDAAGGGIASPEEVERAREEGRKEAEARLGYKPEDRVARYRARADCYLPSNVRGAGGIYYRAGQEFLYSGIPSLRAHEPLDDLARERIAAEEKRRDQEAKDASKRTQAVDALTSAVENVKAR